MLLGAATLLALTSTLAATTWLVLTMAHVSPSIVTALSILISGAADPSLAIRIFVAGRTIVVGVTVIARVAIVAARLALTPSVFVVLATARVTTTFTVVVLALFIVPGVVVPGGTSIFIIVVA